MVSEQKVEDAPWSKKKCIDVWKKYTLYLGRDSGEFNVTRGDNIGQGGKWQKVQMIRYLGREGKL